MVSEHSADLSEWFKVGHRLNPSGSIQGLLLEMQEQRFLLLLPTKFILEGYSPSSCLQPT